MCDADGAGPAAEEVGRSVVYARVIS